MVVTVTSEGSFERDVALARSLDGVVVLSAHQQECYVLSDIGDGKLWFGHHRDVKTHYENAGADGESWFSFRGIAYVSEAEMLADRRVPIG